MIMNGRGWCVGMLCLLMVLGAGGVSGCRQPAPRPDLHAHEVRQRIPGLLEAGRADFEHQAPYLVAALSDDDAAVRLFAFQALQRATGQTHGYRYVDPEATRADAVRRWEAWLNNRPGVGIPSTEQMEGAIGP